HDANQQMTGYSTISRDISASKAAEHELAQHRDHLEELVKERTAALTVSMERLQQSERLASLGTLAAGIAHEINNPLNAILLTTQMAERKPDDVLLHELVQTVKEEAHRAARVVRDVMTFAKQ